ncbi:MAG: ABC transporter permease [Candidatus Aminicenantes bacterium]|nr:ABC transporter permease [Candidatus Aminicenantes bacterium]
MMRRSPSPLAAWVLGKMIDPNVFYSALGDFEERFYSRARDYGLFRAHLYYWFQLFLCIPSFFKNLFYWSFEMIKNYLKVALRILKRHKAYSFINIMGLAIGMASCLLILLYIQDELSYDRYNANFSRIYRITTLAQMGDTGVNVVGAAPPMAKTLVAEYPEVEDAVRFQDNGDVRVSFEEKSFREKRVVYTDASFFNIFTVSLLAGDSEKALASPRTLALSERTAKKYFGESDPIGKTLMFDGKVDYKVTGVFEEIPKNSHFHFDIMASLSSLPASQMPVWLNFNYATYLLLKQDANPKVIDAQFPMIFKKYAGPQIQKAMGKSIEELSTDMGMKIESSLQPLRDVHLHSDLMGELEPNSDVKYIYIMSIIALFILIIASINFMNLSTARSAGRAKEVGLRKVLGSQRKELVRQFLTESLVLSVISLVFAFLLFRLGLRLFNSLSGKEFAISDLNNGFMLTALVGITVLTGLLAGCYPAIFISAYRPVSVLRGRLRTGAGTISLRRSLVVFQFGAAIVLIVGTLVVFNQLRYIQNKKLGFNKEQVLVMDNAHLLKRQAESFKNEILKNPEVVSGTISSCLPVPSGSEYLMVTPEGQSLSEETPPMAVWPVDHDYIKTLEIKIFSGRDFSREHATDQSAALINQRAALHFGWENPLGKRIQKFDTVGGKPKVYNVIGVVEDFHFESLRDSIKPLVLYLGRSTGLISFRIKTEDITGTIGFIRDRWNEFLPGEPFVYSFLDERFSRTYEAEQKIGKIFGVFAGLAIFISCLGLFGLAAFMAEKRTKEIGIRKVLGASVAGIIRLLIKEFVILVGIANLIAWPVAYFIMSRWLNDFAYRISLGIHLFVLAGLVALLIALSTVVFQAIKAALSDPVNSLRYE